MALEPVPLERIARYLRDEEWVDMRVCEAGIFERVQVENVTVFRDREEVVVRHRRPPIEDGGVTTETWRIDAEDIMWINPTVFSEEEAAPPKAATASKGGLDARGGQIDQVFVALMVALASHFKMPVNDIEAEMRLVYGNGNRASQERVDRRHLMLWCLHELTDETTETIYRKLNYKSPMPFHTARQKFTGNWARQDRRWPEVIRDICREARHVSGHPEWHRTQHHDPCVL
jgi:hypothetical protein